MRGIWKHFLNFLVTHGTYRREVLDDDTFYRAYYGDTTIPKDIVIRLRNYFVHDIGSPKHLLTPEYSIFDHLCDELDSGDFIDEIEADFGISLPKEEADKLDGSFDGFVQIVYKASSHGNYM